MVGTHELPTEILKTCTDGFLYCFSKWAYNVTSGFFWIAALLGFCLAIFIASTRLGTTRAFGFASIVGLFGAIFLATATLMPWWIATIFIIVGGVGIVGMIMQGKG